ncbi:uncharacterized protein GGS22DRAFT_160898 [Annulohypoxylon maeteangense]|uniref:uncharacterized protein n=1 Tax=Annulohypoxylon maeteangense TaxID=1927788 RepID=UPI0020088FFC|nr:uncharacterized protein GGS22DRAFT_160898 [Annulohypoxylon maeteangense]KAI0885433.1 hypothetical protein GGS22DRAFT_160898 [Annulohypoxylon maeteangense]
MFARLRPEQAPTPLKSDSSARFKSLKRRLFASDEEDDDIRSPPQKRPKQGHYSITPLLNKYKNLADDEDDQPSTRQHGRRRHLSPSPDSELVKELDGKPLTRALPNHTTNADPDRYTHLRATMHSAALSSLSTAEHELAASSERSIRSKRQNLASMESQLKSLVAPLRDLTVDYMATGENGLPRTVAVNIRDAISAFETSLEKTVTELAGLWEEWEETQVEIDGLAAELGASSRGDDGGVGKGVVGGTASARDEVVVGIAADLDKASEDVVEEMATYEEVSPRPRIWSCCLLWELGVGSWERDRRLTDV